MSLRIPEGMLDPDGGRVLAYIVCGVCGSKVIGAVQEHWNPRGQIEGAHSIRGYFGKVPDSAETLIGASPLRPSDELSHLVMCPRHGALHAEMPASLDPATRVVVRAVRA